MVIPRCLLIVASIHATVHAGPVGAIGKRRHLQNNDFWTEFASIRDDMVWPLPNSNASFISSTFGFRKHLMCDCNDFHRGVDIQGETGDPVLASYSGTVKKVTTSSSGNKIVVLEHKFANDVNFHGHIISTWYTNYFHLDEQLVKEGDLIAAGDLIGRVGNTGVQSGESHLHHEVLLGTRCSLVFALNNLDSTCNTLGVDPHVHPLYIYPRHVIGQSSVKVTLQQNVTSSNDGEIRVMTPRECADLNRFEVHIHNTADDTIRASHVLDYNLRIGLNPNSTAELDAVDTTKPYLKPISGRSSSFMDNTEWKMALILPTLWVGSKAPYEVFVVIVTNIWQETTTIPVFGMGDSWCKW